MTRVLAELLGAEQPGFSQVVRQLEHAAGGPSTDIRLTTEINQRVQEKLRELGLDPIDTTSKELYRALEERFGQDEAAVRTALQLDENATIQDVLLAIQRFTSAAIADKQSFVLKTAVAKRLFKKVPPKKAMKLLNYRSLASMLKHEPASFVYAASFLSESNAWKKKFLSQYEALQPRDFETRPIEVVLPQHTRWAKLAHQGTQVHKHNVMVFSELGSIVLLPLEKDMPGLAITDTLLILHAANEIVSTGSYRKLHQVNADFGITVRAMADGEPMTNTHLIDKQVPWKVIHQYYARFKDAYNPNIFEPHVNQGDLKWYSPERALEALHPSLSFWRDTPYTALAKDGARVSLNLLDVAVNYCNHLGFNERVAEFARTHLWQEFMIRYFNLENVEQALGQELQPEFVPAEENALGA